MHIYINWPPRIDITESNAVQRSVATNLNRVDCAVTILSSVTY